MSPDGDAAAVIERRFMGWHAIGGISIVTAMRTGARFTLKDSDIP